jgi:RNA polymerase sigma-54 factor
MTPELIQAIQILQFNTQELEKYVEEQLLANPILEKGERDEAADYGKAEKEAAEPKVEEPADEPADREIDWAEHFRDSEYDDISYQQWRSGGEKNEYSYEQFVSADVTLTDHLLFQLNLLELRPACCSVARYLIEALDENGYLTVSVDEVARLFNLPLDRVEHALKIVQGFEPVGVGARDLAECLRIQMRTYGIDTPQAFQVIDQHLEDIADNRLGAIARAVGLTVREVQEISDIIRSLEPKPGRQYSSCGENRYIVPDVTVDWVDDEFIITVNDSTAPRLTLSPYYQKLLIEADKESNISKFLTGRLNSAMWLIKSIEQRRQTIHNVVKAVVHYQEEFFEKGQKFLKPLTLKQIADEVGVHESTVSRSVNGKYMQTPRGLFEIKYFFTSGVAAFDGSGIASESIKTIMRELIEAEDPREPYSDQALVNIMAKQGISISRRTIAKYRDEMHLPASSKRRRFD